MTVARSGRRRRVAALQVAAALVVGTALLSSAGVADGSGPGACASARSFGVAADSVQGGLTVSPSSAEPGDFVTVSRADHRTMDFGALMLYGNAEASCRVFVLMPHGAGDDWREIAGERWYGFMTVVSPSAASEEYVLPDVAEHGTYLLCTDGAQPPILCGDVTL